MLATFAATVIEDVTTEVVLQQLARGAVRALGVDGAGVMVPYDEELLSFAFATGPCVEVVAVLERLQEQLRAGPCGDTYREQRTINIADLAVEGRWPTYQEAAVEAGLRAVATLPLVARGRRWGVLDLYRREPRRLDADELAAAQALTQVAASYLEVTADRAAAQRTQEELAHRAMHDPLTGLPVRWVFLEQLTHALARLDRHPGQVGVLFADLDGLKHVNDTYGHEAGDRLLLTCVERIQAAVRPSDVVARLGGDEFVVLLEDLHGVDTAAAVAHRVLAELGRPYRPDGEVVQPSASLGLALTADAETRPATLVAHADSAMYRAKRAGRGRYEVFDEAGSVAAGSSVVGRTAGRDDPAGDLRSALRTGQLALHYQPVVDLAHPGAGDSAAPAGRVYALEALARWQHPERGLLVAQDFLPLAESAGLMPELGAWVLSTACRQLTAWDDELGDRAPSRLFVNVSPAELAGRDLARRLAAVLDRAGVAPGRLTLEISGTGRLDELPAVEAELAALRALGCQLAVADAGGGCSLGALVGLPASTWKVDRSFTGALASQRAAAAVVSAVLQLGGRLDRTVVVEGVEDSSTVQALRRLGCTHAQGFHLGRPQDARHVAALLRGR